MGGITTVPMNSNFGEGIPLIHWKIERDGLQWLKGTNTDVVNFLHGGYIMG